MGVQVRENTAEIRHRFAVYHDKRSEWVVHHEFDRRNATAGTCLGSLRRAFAGAVKRAKLPADLRQHDLRNRRVTVWLAEGRAPQLVQKAMGYSDVRTTMGYEHLVDEDLLQLVEPAPERRNAAEG